MTDNSTTIQTWPSGKSYEYRGDIDGPAELRTLRDPRRNETPASDWRAGTPAEWRDVRIAVRAEMYQRRDILRCQSSLVDDLIKLSSDRAGELADAFSYDNVDNIYKDPTDWTADQCREYISDHGLTLPDRPGEDDDLGVVRRALAEPSYAAALEADAHSAEGQIWTEYKDADEDDSRHGYLSELRETCRDHAQDNPAEVFEWWLVDPWLCARLRDIGEVVIDNGYGEWWGRTCTGQGLIMDGTLQQIAALYESEV